MSSGLIWGCVMPTQEVTQEVENVRGVPKFQREASDVYSVWTLPPDWMRCICVQSHKRTNQHKAVLEVKQVLIEPDFCHTDGSTSFMLATILA